MSKYRIPRATDTPVVKPSSTTATFGGGALVGFGSGAATVLILALLVFAASKGGCSLDWPSVGPKAGPRGLVILRESSKDTPSFKALKIAMQGGDAEIESYRKSKGHQFLILDVDAKDSQTNESPKIVQEWKAAIGDVEYPAQVIYELSTRKILDKRHLPDGSTAAQSIDHLKAKGG